MIENLLVPLLALFAAVTALRWLGLRVLHRFAPNWMVGPGGFLIDTRGRLGLLQMGDGHTDPRGDHAASDHRRTECD